MDKRRFLLLDFDGVIADTFLIGHAVAQKMCVYLTESEYRKRFERNIHDVQNALGAVDHGDRCDHALDWLAAYAPGFKTGAHPFLGMPELVRGLSREHMIFVVSSTHDELIRHFLEKYGLADAIEDIYGAGINTRKDEKFRAIFEKYEAGSENTVFVTDTLGDINEAASVGLSSIGVTWGFQDRATLLRGDPFAIVDSPQELPGVIEKYFSMVHELALQ